MEDLVGGERETELGRAAQHAGRAALEEGAEALLLEDGLGAVSQGGVRGLALARLDLQAGLDDIARRGQVGGRHASDGAGAQELEDAQLLGVALAEVVALEVVVGWEVDGREGHVAKEAGGGALVQTHETQVAYNPHGGPPRGVGDGFRNLALYLQSDLDDLEGVCEDLCHVSVRYISEQVCTAGKEMRGKIIQLDRRQPRHLRGSHAEVGSCRQW